MIPIGGVVQGVAARGHAIIRMPLPLLARRWVFAHVKFGTGCLVIGVEEALAALKVGIEVVNVLYEWVIP